MPSIGGGVCRARAGWGGGDGGCREDSFANPNKSILDTIAPNLQEPLILSKHANKFLYFSRNLVALL